MRITESKLRSVIRSVLIEGEKDLKHYEKKWEKIKKSKRAQELDGYDELKNNSDDLDLLRGFIGDYEETWGKIRVE